MILKFHAAIPFADIGGHGSQAELEAATERVKQVLMKEFNLSDDDVEIQAMTGYSDATREMSRTNAADVRKQKP